jgi:hypothetical protein
VSDETDETDEASYPSFKGTLAAKGGQVETWSLRDLEIEPETVGAAAAATAVFEVSPRPPRRAGDGDHRRRQRRSRNRDVPSQQAADLSSSFRRDGAEMTEILVLVDHVDGTVTHAPKEILTLARQLGDPVAVGVGPESDRTRAELGRFSACKVHLVDSP